MPRGWEIGSKQPCIKCQKNSATHFVYFWSLKNSSLYTSGTTFINYKSKVKAFTFERLPHLLQTVTKISTLCNFLSMVCISRSARGNFMRWNWVSAWHYKGNDIISIFIYCLCVYKIQGVYKVPVYTLTLIVPSANSISLLKLPVADRLIHGSNKNCILYLFL